MPVAVLSFFLRTWFVFMPQYVTFVPCNSFPGTSMVYCCSESVHCLALACFNYLLHGLTVLASALQWLDMQLLNLCYSLTGV
jgi:hypothetical protein